MTPSAATLPADLATNDAPNLYDIICCECNRAPAELVDEDGQAFCRGCIDDASAADGYPEHTSRPRWQIDDDSKAEWAMRHFADLEAQIANKQALAAEWLDQIRDWLDGETSKLADHQAFFGDALKDYLRRQREADDKVKSISLPSGKVASKAVAAKVVVSDPDTAVRWLEGWARIQGRDPEELIRIKRSPIAAAIKQIPPEEFSAGVDGVGMRWIEPDVSYRVEVGR